MKKNKRVRRLGMILILLLGVITSAHAFMFPQETRCMLIDLYDFDKEGNCYFREHVPAEVREQIKQLVQQAESRNNTFWKGLEASTKYIYCDEMEDFYRFGVPFDAPACANQKIGSYVVLNKNGANLDVLAHERAHAEFFVRLGFFDRLKLPVWFHEGIAMQLDYREGYSEEKLRELTNDLTELPDLNQWATPEGFVKGPLPLNYAYSRHVVKQWISHEKLMQFVDDINAGKSFEESFGGSEK